MATSLRLSGTYAVKLLHEAICRHDHRLKHEVGWQVHQPQRGYFRWTSCLGRSYLRKPPPVMEPLPEPCAPTQPLMPLVISGRRRLGNLRDLVPSTAGA